jgi:hypothetical protein
MNDEPEMAEQIVGGNVFEFTTEIANLVNEKSESLISLSYNMVVLTIRHDASVG